MLLATIFASLFYFYVFYTSLRVNKKLKWDLTILLRYHKSIIQNMNTTNDMLTVIKNFMIDIHSELSQPTPQPITQSQLDLIDKATIQLKTRKQNIVSLQHQTTSVVTQRLTYQDLKKEHKVLEKKYQRKQEELDILKQTVKTLYQDNEKISKEKEEVVKQYSSQRQNVSVLKKKLKRQQQQMSAHKQQLQKLTNLAEERLNQYVQEDQQKQLKIKKLTNQLEKVKHELGKKQKALSSANKKVEENRNKQTQFESMITMIETLKYENQLSKNELESVKSKIHDEKLKYLQQNESLLRQIEKQNEKITSLTTQKQQIALNLQTTLQKSQTYEEQILIRTQKLKQKNKQLKLYNQQLEKLTYRVKQLSSMTDDLMNENKQLQRKCFAWEEKFEEVKILQEQLGRMKGELSYKKSVELGRLIDGISKLKASL